MKTKCLVFAILAAFYLSCEKSASEPQAAAIYFPPNTGSEWESISPGQLGWNENEIGGLYSYLEQRDSKAFIVLKDGKIVLEKYFGAFTKDSLWHWASAGKSFVGFLAGIAKQEGFLSLNDPASDYLQQGWTSCPAAKEQKITVRHQLTMTSGLENRVPNDGCTHPSCLQYLADAGDRWAYHNAPYYQLQELIEVATGQNLNAYANAKIKKAIGMNGAFIRMGDGQVNVSDARSMARFGLLVLNKGNWNGIQVLKDTAYYNQMVNASTSLNPFYGYLWWLNNTKPIIAPRTQPATPFFPNAPEEAIVALGKNGQLINIVPSKRLVFIRMGNLPNDLSDYPGKFNDSIWVKLNKVIR